MRDKNQSDIILVQVLQNLYHVTTGGTIKITRGFIGKNDFGLHDGCTGYGNPLPLPA
jgi:hypothetical protein